MITNIRFAQCKLKPQNNQNQANKFKLKWNKWSWSLQEAIVAKCLTRSLTNNSLGFNILLTITSAMAIIMMKIIMMMMIMIMTMDDNWAITSSKQIMMNYEFICQRWISSKWGPLFQHEIVFFFKYEILSWNVGDELKTCIRYVEKTKFRKISNKSSC